MSAQIYHLDPDFRRTPEPNGRVCCRCRKPFKNENGIPVTVNWENWRIVEGHGQYEAVRGSSNQYPIGTYGDEFIGAYCWKVTKKDKVNNA